MKNPAALRVTITGDNVVLAATMEGGHLKVRGIVAAELVVAIEEKIRSGQPKGEVVFNEHIPHLATTFTYEVHRPGA